MKRRISPGMRAIQSVYEGARRIGNALYRSNPEFAEHDQRAEFIRRAFHALGFNGIRGDYAEFGCHGGRTFGLSYSEIIRWPQTRMMWAFDSFQGLPEHKDESDFHPGWKKGKMATSRDRFVAICRRHGIPDDRYRIVPGFYDETLDGKAPDDPDLPADIAFAYVDCDLYSSTVSVLEFLKPRLKHGMIIAMDDYFCYSDRTISGNRKAMLEILEPHAEFNFLPFLSFGWHGMSYIVEKRSLLPDAPQPA